MKTMVETKIIMAATLLAVVLPANGAAAEKDHGVPVAATVPGTPFEVSRNVSSLLDTYCFSCHDEETRKGDLRLDNLETMPLEARLDLMNRMQEQIFLREMPPKKKKQPEEVERDLLSAWLSGELRAHNASKLEDKLRKPEFGNVVDHDKLFSGKYKDLPAFTPDRRWLISEFIFEDKINRIMGLSTARGIDGKRRPVVGYNHRNGVSLTNPFLLPAHSGVRYYDTTILDGGHLQTMIGNAREISSYLLSQSKRNNSLLPAFNKLMAAEWEHEKVLAARESYLKSRIEPLLRELFMDRHAAMLPKFVPQPAQPVATVGPDGKPLPRPNFHEAAPSREDVNEIWAAMRRNSTPGDNDEALITKCEREWFVYGVNERTLQIRLEFMRGYMEHLHKDMPKQVEAAPPPPADSELIIIRHALQQHRKEGDTYSAIIAKCVAGWADEFAQIRRKANPFTEPLISELVEQIFTRIMERAPSEQEKSEYISLTMSYAEKQGSEKAVDRLIQSIMLRSDFVYRSEFGVGEADAHGRRLLPPRDASYAIAYALTDSSPDKGLTEAAASGRLNTREDYRREVERLLQAREPFYIVDAAVDSTHVDNITDLPIRKLRFFREFFGYPRLLAIFKDNKRFGGDYNPTTTARLVAEADMIVEHILKKDQNVFESLLTTEEFFVYHSGDNQAMSATVENISQVYEYFKDKDWKNFNAEQLKAHLPFLKEHPIPRVELDLIGSGGPRAQGSLDSFKRTMASFHERLGNGQTAAVPFSSFYGAPDHAKTRSRIEAMRGEQVAKFYGLNLVNWNYPAVQPAKMEHRKGMLTHPAWLIAFAGNTATDPIRRGKWVREKLLAGTVPDVPITVDAVIPEDHHKTLRQRLDKVTQAEYCWKCHERMNPLGTTFEIYDDFGRYRTEESLEHPDNLVKKIPAERGAPQDDLRHIYKTLPVNATGRLEGTGDSKLDGDIRDAIDLTGRLAKSTRVRQSIIRHAFRYFMGRNEVLSDSKTLIDADQAYVQSGGSFDAVIISLLTSDSFIYRKTTTD